MCDNRESRRLGYNGVVNFSSKSAKRSWYQHKGPLLPGGYYACLALESRVLLSDEQTLCNTGYLCVCVFVCVTLFFEDHTDRFCVPFPGKRKSKKSRPWHSIHCLISLSQSCFCAKKWTLFFCCCCCCHYFFCAIWLYIYKSLATHAIWRSPSQNVQKEPPLALPSRSS